MNAPNAASAGRNIRSVKKLDQRYLAYRDFGYTHMVEFSRDSRFIIATWLHTTFGPSMHHSYPRVLYKKSYWHKNPDYGFFKDENCVFLSERAVNWMMLAYA